MCETLHAWFRPAALGDLSVLRTDVKHTVFNLKNTCTTFGAKNQHFHYDTQQGYNTSR